MGGKKMMCFRAMRRVGRVLGELVSSGCITSSSFEFPWPGSWVRISVSIEGTPKFQSQKNEIGRNIVTMISGLRDFRFPTRA